MTLWWTACWLMTSRLLIYWGWLSCSCLSHPPRTNALQRWSLYLLFSNSWHYRWCTIHFTHGPMSFKLSPTVFSHSKKLGLQVKQMGTRENCSIYLFVIPQRERIYWVTAPHFPYHPLFNPTKMLFKLRLSCVESHQNSSFCRRQQKI